MRKKVAIFMIVLAILSAILVVYTVWDNNRVIVASHGITIDHLPDDLEDFKILQITDLHEKEFGKDQSKLIKTINSIDYDAIVFTGDLLKTQGSKNYSSVYKLLDGIQNKKNAFYVPGNEDPEVYHVSSKGILKKDEFVKGMEKRGVKLLESVYSIKKNKSTIYFVNFDMSVQNINYKVQMLNGVVTPQYQQSSQFVNQRKQLLKQMEVLDHAKGSDVIIALNHFPVADARIDQLRKDPTLKYRDYDLIIAGHYHGGQVRIPFVGALFVPEAFSNRNGFFPPRNRVKGLWEYKNTKQYVSAGLGSSEAVPFLKFRIFNPPEINLLTLKREVNHRRDTGKLITF